MAQPIVDENEFIRLCETFPTISEVAQHLGMNERAARKRLARLRRKYGPIAIKSTTPQSCINYHKVTHQIHEPEPITIVAFSDAHFWPTYLLEPSDSYSILLQILKVIKPDYIIDGGDSFDGAMISRHPPHGWQDLPSPEEELTCNIDFHKEIAKTTPKAKKLWCWGNHDARYDSRLAMHAGEFKGIKGFTLPDHFPDWTFAESIILNDSLFIKHSWHGGIGASRNNTLKSGKSFMTGHLHRLQATPVTDFNGTRYGIEMGTLADPRGPQFFYTGGNPTDWQQGFAVITVYGNRIVPEMVEVVNKKAIFRGKVYES